MSSAFPTAIGNWLVHCNSLYVNYFHRKKLFTMVVYIVFAERKRKEGETRARRGGRGRMEGVKRRKREREREREPGEHKLVRARGGRKEGKEGAV
jgi:hypothetical protein